MRLINLDKISNTRLKLALTYLSIIMVLFVSFSIIFYQASTANLQIKVIGGPEALVGTGTLSPPPDFTNQPSVTSTSPSDDQKMLQVPPLNQDEITKLNSKLEDTFAKLKVNLRNQLIILNVIALVAGAFISYYLALKTLQPIELAMDAQERFTADASHELRTPLAIMQAEIEVVLAKKELSLARAKAALESNYAEVGRLKSLSEGLLDLTKAPLTSKDFKELKLNKLVTEAINRVVKLAQIKDITIDDQLPKIIINAEGSSLTQALVILLDNAIKYSPEGSVIQISGSVENKTAYLNIEDQGIGIKPNDLPHIFERFYRADTARNQANNKGYGLGLSIAKQIVDQHSGKLSVVSSAKKGSTFTINLPVSDHHRGASKRNEQT